MPNRGYLAPEYALGGHLTMKADVYSYGILTLEVVSGRNWANADHGGEQKLLAECVRDSFQTFFAMSFYQICALAITAVTTSILCVLVKLPTHGTS